MNVWVAASWVVAMILCVCVYVCVWMADDRMTTTRHWVYGRRLYAGVSTIVLTGRLRVYLKYWTVLLSTFTSTMSTPPMQWGRVLWSVCLSTRISQKPHIRTSPESLWLLHVNVVWSVALWHVMCHISYNRNNDGLSHSSSVVYGITPLLCGTVLEDGRHQCQTSP